MREQFAFEEAEEGTSFHYQGELAMDFWIFGRMAGRYLVAPTWEKVVRLHMENVKGVAEGRAARRHGG